ncbi:MAG: sulfurtransferase [Corynebacterium sp.]|nr:sulfurtransferase [Corynebacterium sp.]
MSIFMSPQELYDVIHQAQRYTLLAALWGVGDDDGEGQFNSLHIPTAQLCDASAALAGLPGSKDGRNPIPDPRQLQSWFERWGIRNGRPVIVYDEGRGLFAGRAWWMLRWAGVKDVRILDGGLVNWCNHEFPTLTGPGNISVESDAVVSPQDEMVATIDDVHSHTGVLIDSREPNRFAGRRENLDLKAGHIPGAVNIPDRLLRNADHTWKSAAEIRDIFQRAGINHDNVADAIVYSGSGNHSAATLAAMESVGLMGARHFVGGWSQWSADPTNPVERGDRSSVTQ